MIEANLETKIIDKLTTVLDSENVKFLGTFSAVDVEELKNEEDSSSGFCTVAVSPRSYDSPMTPTARIDVTISLILRSDVDYNGQTYLDLCDKLMTQFEIWQKCLDDAHTDFSTDGFEVAGYVLGNGSTGIDKGNCLWTYEHSMTIYGVVQPTNF